MVAPAGALEDAHGVTGWRWSCRSRRRRRCSGRTARPTARPWCTRRRPLPRPALRHLRLQRGARLAAAYQASDHPVADHAKAVMQVAAAGTGARPSDGSTNLLPVGAGPRCEAWRCTRELVTPGAATAALPGLGPAPGPAADPLPGHVRVLPGGAAGRARPAAPPTSGRDRGGVLDEPATARALAAVVLRALDCGAVDEDEIAASTGPSRTSSEALDAGRGARRDGLDLVVAARRVPRRRSARPPGRRRGRPDRRGRAVGGGPARGPDGPARRRRRAAAGAGRHARARQRARPDRVGGLRHRHRGGRGRRRHDDPRHAAEQHPADRRPRPRSRSSGPRRRARCTSTSASGAAPSPATSATCGRCTTPACSAFKCFLLDSGVPEFPPLDPAQLRAALTELRRSTGC